MYIFFINIFSFKEENYYYLGMQLNLEFWYNCFVLLKGEEFLGIVKMVREIGELE